MRTDTAVYGGLAGSATAAGVAVIAVAVSGVAGETPAFWYLSRASGLVAYSLLWLSVVAGLFLSGRVGRELLPPRTAMELHQTVSGTALAFALFHGLVLTGDRFIGFGLLDVLVPLAGSFQPLWVAGGQVSLGLSAALLASSLLRRHLGNRLWRALHYGGFAAYWLALAHAIVLGSDTPVLFYAVTAGSVLWLTTARILLRETPRGG